MKRLLAFCLSLLMVLLTPGAPAYEAFAQTVGKTGASAGSLGGAATAVNFGVGNGAPTAPLVLPAQSPGLAGVPAPTLAPTPAAAINAATAKKTAAGPSGPAAGAKQIEAFFLAAQPVLEGAQDADADATLALNGVYENAAARGELGAVSARLGAEALSPGLARSAPTVGQAAAELPGVEAPVVKSGLRQRLRSAFDLSEFNKSEKSYILGQAVFLFAISVYLASLPLLVSALTGDAAMTGVARMVHYWVFGGASLFAGAVVGKNPMRRILIGAAGARALLFGTIGALALFGGLPWGGLLALVGVNALIVAHNHLVDIDTGGAAKIFKGADRQGTDRKIEKAGYVYDFIYYGMMLVVPALIGLPMDWLDARFGAGIGAAAGFSLFAALMGVASYIYATRVVTIGDAPAAPLVGIKDFLSRAIASMRTFGRILIDVPRRNWATVKIILGNKAVLARSMMATMENFVEDALFYVVLPTFAIDILRVGAFGNGLLLSAVTAGGLAASLFLVKRIQDLQKKHGTYAVLAGLTALAALAFVPSIGLWLAPSIASAIAAVFMMKLMLQPLRSRMRALLQTEIKNDPKAAPYADDIYSLMTFVEVLAAGAGGLAFAWLFHHSLPGSALALVVGALAPMKIVTAALFAMAFVYLGGLLWVKAHLSKPARSAHLSPEGNEARMLALLAISLKENGLPEHKTAVLKGPSEESLPAVAILAHASRHKVAIAREGGRQAPGDVHLVLDASWLISERSFDGRAKLLVKKGVVFDEKGQATVVEYESPRRVRYFADYFTPGANDRDDGAVFEENLDVPQSSSLRLEKAVNDKLGTRLILAAKAIAVPATMALLMAGHPLAGQRARNSGGVRVADMPAAEVRAVEVGHLVDAYLASFKGKELVVKPSGPQFHSGRGVKFFRKSERDAIVAHALALSADARMTGDGAVLLDERVNSAPLDRGGGKMETTVRVLAARTPWGGVATMDMFARVGPWGKPTTAEAADPRDNAAVEPMEKLFSEWKKAGLLDDRSARELEARMRRLGSDALAAIIERERDFKRKDGEPYQAQTDMIGLDVMIERRDGKLVPVVIEVNDHDSGGQYNLDLMRPERAGEHSREWVATMLQRARRDVLKGKRVVLVGAGYRGKRFIFEKAKTLGVEVLLVDKKTSFVEELLRDGLIGELIETDNARPKEALAAAKKKLLRSMRRNGKIDGMTTFWEDDVPLTADLAQELGLPYHTPAAAKSARSKAEARAMMAKAGLPTPRNRKIPLPVKAGAGDAADEQAVSAAREQFRRDLEFVGYPAVLKPAFGASALGVKKVTNRAEAPAAFEEVRAVVTPEVDSIFAQGADLVLEQYLDGREYDVDIVMRGGKPLFVSVTDNWPTREPYFLATGSSLPSRLLNAKEQKEAGDLATRAARALGLTDGVIHVEGKYTKDGPRIIEANGRMGGEYVHDWVQTVWGVSLVEEGLMIAAGIGGRPFMAPRPLTYLEGEFIIPAESGVISAFDLSESARLQAGFHELRVKKQVGERIAVPPVGYERAGMLVARGASSAEAQKNIAALRAKLLLDVKPDSSASDAFVLKARRRFEALRLVEASRHGARPEGEVATDDEMRGRLERLPVTNPEREKFMIELFKLGGAADSEVVLQDAGRGRNNIMVVKKGRTDRVIVVGGHYDKVREGEGKIDNGTGATMVANLYQALRDLDVEATIVFIAFAREEEGLLGSAAYVRSLSKEQRDKIDAMINLDTLAVDGTFSWKNNSTRAVLDRLARVSRETGHALKEAYLNGGDADSSSFRDAGIPAATVYGASQDVIFDFQTRSDIIHSDRDTMAVFKLEHYKNAYLLVLEVIKSLDRAPLGPIGRAGAR